MAGINRDQSSAGSIEIGLEPKHGAVVVDENILRVEVVEESYYLRIRLSQILIVEAVLGRSALPDLDDQIVAVVGDVAAESQLFFVRTVVDQFVFGLGGPEAVI